MKTDTEAAVLQELARILIPNAKLAFIHRSGNYVHGRKIELSTGRYSPGPMIGSKGAMQLAIKTILAAPLSSEQTTLHFRSPRADEVINQPQSPPSKPEVAKVEPLMWAIRRHVGEALFDYRFETSESCCICLIESNAVMVAAMKGALHRLLYGCGRQLGFKCPIVFETHQTTQASG